MILLALTIWVFSIIGMIWFWPREDRTFGALRSSKWPQVRWEHLKKFPLCAVCGRKGKLLSPNEAHHIYVFHKWPARELDLDNLITLCRHDHLLWGHFQNFKSWNLDVKKDAELFNNRIKNRP